MRRILFGLPTVSIPLHMPLGVSNTSTRLRHLPFLKALAASAEDSPAAHLALAGLLVMRLIDVRVMDPELLAVDDGRTERATRNAIQCIDSGNETRAILHGVLDAAMDADAAGTHVLWKRLMFYARELNLDASWRRAIDVYDTILDGAHAAEDDETVGSALARRAACLRELGFFDEASLACDAAIEYAKHRGDRRGELRARLGRAKLAVARGNLPLADAILAELVREASREGLVDVRSRALQDRAEVAFVRGDPTTAMRFAFSAFHECADDTERERLLSDIGAVFKQLGLVSAARDVWMLLVAGAREQRTRWACAINLMELSAEEGSRAHFERYREQLADTLLPPPLQAEFELHVGCGYQLLGEPVLAREWLERALRTARTFSMHRLAFKAEQALAAGTLTRPDPQRATPTLNQLRNVHRFVEQVRVLRAGPAAVCQLDVRT